MLRPSAMTVMAVQNCDAVLTLLRESWTIECCSRVGTAQIWQPPEVRNCPEEKIGAESFRVSLACSTNYRGDVTCSYMSTLLLSIDKTLPPERADYHLSVFRFGCDVRGAAACALTATCGGALVVDLQPRRARRSPVISQDSLLLGPLPCRASNISKQAAHARKYMYGLPPVTVENFQPPGSHQGSSSRPHAFSGSSSVRRVSAERSVFPSADRSGVQAHHAAYLWRRLSGECALVLMSTSRQRRSR